PPCESAHRGASPPPSAPRRNATRGSRPLYPASWQEPTVPPSCEDQHGSASLRPRYESGGGVRVGFLHDADHRPGRRPRASKAPGLLKVCRRGGVRRALGEHTPAEGSAIGATLVSVPRTLRRWPTPWVLRRVR